MAVSQDQLAAAQIAQIFGSELLNAQQNAQTDSGSQPNFIKVHPRDILTQQHGQGHNVRTQTDQQMMAMLQREAEASYPLPEPPAGAPQPPPLPAEHLPPPLPNRAIPPALPPALTLPAARVAPVPAPGVGDVWERISDSLERIADRLEAVDIVIKKKRVKRKKSPNTTLLQSTNPPPFVSLKAEDAILEGVQVNFE